LSVTLLSTLAPAQTPSEPTPAAVFESARRRLLSDMERQPRYTCAQNVTRQLYRTTSRKKQSCSAIIAAFDARKHDPPLASWNRLQLDVAFVDNHEIHSWPGASRFSEDEIRCFIRYAPFGTGDFVAFITAIFGGSATVKFRDQSVKDARRLFEYTYEVPVESSGYHVETGSGFITSAYSGSFALDPETADIFELTVSTAEFPPSVLTACQARSQIEYARVNIHGRQVLIPRETRLRAIDRDGSQGLNIVSYSACREFTSKSVVGFDNPDLSAIGNAPAQPPGPESAPPHALPARRKFKCRFVTPIDSETAAAGSPIDAILLSPIPDQNGTVLARSGARIHARLVRFAQYLKNPDYFQYVDYFEVGIRLESVEINGMNLPLNAVLDQPAIAPVFVTAQGDRSDPQRGLAPPLPREVGEFFFVRDRLQIRQLDSSWVTVAPDAINSAPESGAR
jgi:hypothetical protein